MATLTGGRGWASDACAASVHRMDSAFGRILPITSAGRSWDEQNRAYQLYKSGRGPLALPPGTSVHEKGNAIDWGNAVWGLLGLNAGTGWRGQPVNRNGHRRTVQSETWHTEYDVNEDNFRGQGGGGSGSREDTINRQNWLNHARGEKLVVDGDPGPATIAAYKRYQEFLGVAVDGDWGPATQAAHQKYYDSLQNPYAQYGGAPWIKAIQNKLNRLGYSLAEDGEDGPATQAAVKDFQSKNGLSVDGVAGPATNAKLDDKLTAAPVGRNATGRPTVEIQNFLKSKGYDIGQYGADGDYGAATTKAVIAYQKDNGLEPDGIWGPVADAKAFPPASVGGNQTTRSTWDVQRLVGATPDGVWGPDTTAKVIAWQSANGLTADGIWGPSSDAKGFPSTPVSNYPTNGRNATTRKTEDIQKLVGAEVDGSYGPNTSTKVAAWQEKNGLDADGIWGPASDLKGFPGVPLPDAPADPTQDPLYGRKKPLYPDAAWADVSPNKSVREGEIRLFIWHHEAGFPTNAESMRRRYMVANDRNVSPNYRIRANGQIEEFVPPDDYRAWTTGAVDHFAYTAETENVSGAPAWGISPESHEAAAQLFAWGAHRYGITIQRGLVVLENGVNVVKTPGIVGHRDTPAGKSTGTACPGPSANLDWVIARAKEIFAEKYAPKPDVPVEPEVPGVKMVSVPEEFLTTLRDNQLADAAEIDKYL